MNRPVSSNGLTDVAQRTNGSARRCQPLMACMTDGRPGAGRWPRTVTMGGIPVAAVFG